MKKLLVSSGLFFVLPLVVFAQSAPVVPASSSGGQLTNVQNLVHSAASIIASIIPILIALALIFFFYGLIQYIRKPEWEEGKKIMIAGIVSLFVMVAIWGIVLFAASALGVGVGGSAPAPGLPGYTGGTTGTTLTTSSNVPLAP